jgi:hypothetical protein
VPPRICTAAEVCPALAGTPAWPGGWATPKVASFAERWLTATLLDMTDSIAARLTPTTVIRNGKVRAAGRRMEQVIVYDWGYEYDGKRYEQRSFVLLDDGFQINQPVVFPPERRGWWYCDLVRIVEDGGVAEHGRRR